MRPINAFSIAPDGKDWLANTRYPRILHVFGRACNLIDDRREVLSIVTPQIGNGPFNLVSEDDVLFSKHLIDKVSRSRTIEEWQIENSDQQKELLQSYRVSKHTATRPFVRSLIDLSISLQSPISIFLNHLTLGNLTINTAAAKLWSPRPNWEVLHAKRDNILNQLSFLPTTRPLLPNSLVSSLSHALANADLCSSLNAAQKLAGLGQGLTPAGDDSILGTIYAAWIIHSPEVASVLAEEVANTAAPLTTSLSAAWLRSAGRGGAGILWHEFFDALISSDPARIQEAMDKILDVGETSGADALVGFISLFIGWMGLCSNLWEYNQP